MSDERARAEVTMNFEIENVMAQQPGWDGFWHYQVVGILFRTDLPELAAIISDLDGIREVVFDGAQYDVYQEIGVSWQTLSGRIVEAVEAYERRAHTRGGDDE